MTFNLDTTFLIDLERERKRGMGPALRFLQDHQNDIFYVSTIAWGEFTEGRSSENEDALRNIRGAVQLLPVTEAVAEVYARITRQLRQAGELIGSNDLWIAATGLDKNLPLVTRNRSEFKRVPDLKVVDY